MKTILIIQTAFIGDVILATPVIERLRRCYPDAKIDFLLRKGNESLLESHPHLRRVLIRDKKGDGKWASLWKMLRAVRAEKYDLVVNLHRFLSSGIIAGFSKGRHICGFNKNPFFWRYHRKVRHRIPLEGGPSVHEVDRNLSVITHLTEGDPDPLRLYPSEADFAKVKQNEKYYCIAPTSVWFTKQWPADKWVALIGKLEPSMTVFLLGGPGDASACISIATGAEKSHPKIEVKAGELSLLASAALMQGAVMNFVNDSAPLHMASAMEAPVTAVFLSTIPAFGFGPRNENGRVVETTIELSCRPCGLHGRKKCPKGHFLCSDIDVVEVAGEAAASPTEPA